MTAPALKQSQSDLALNIVQGPDKGISYKLLGSVIRIGRSVENDVVLADAKSSRHHARIEKRGEDYWIVDLGSQNGFLVNGKRVKEKILAAGDQIVLGGTTMVFGPANPVHHRAPSLISLKMPASPRQPISNKTIMPIFVILFGVVAIMLLFKGSAIKRKMYKISDETAMEEQIENIDKANEARQIEIFRRGKNTQQYAEAQSFYLQGSREFREGNYIRAIQDFQTALTLYPDHPLAKRYFSRARLKLNEEITGAMERGERDFQTQRYMSAFNEYRTVLLLTNDPTNKNAQLAQKRIEAIRLIMVNSR